MSIVTSVLKFGQSAYKVGKRAAKVYPSFVFGESANVAAKVGINTAKTAPIKQAWTAANKAAYKEALKASASGNIFKQAWNAVKNIPRTLSVYTKKGVVEAGIKNSGFFGKLWGGTKGFFKGIGKKMPLIGNLILVASYLPNIITATKEQGIGEGVKETLKSAAKLGGAAAGAAIGTVLCPIPVVGSIVGWIAGEWLAGKVVGKDYTEKKAEQQQKAEEQMAYLEELYKQQPAPGPQVPFQGNPFGDPYMNNPMFNSPGSYSEDIMAQRLKFNQIA